MNVSKEKNPHRMSTCKINVTNSKMRCFKLLPFPSIGDIT